MTPKQAAFAEEYLIDLNGTQAAIRAGYSARTAHIAAHKLLAKPAIAARVAELKRARSEALAVDAQWVLEQAVEVYKRCAQAIEPALHPKTRRQLKSEDGRPLFTFNSASALRALELIGKHVDIGAFRDFVTVQGEISLIDRITAARRAATQARVVDATAEPVALPPPVNPRAEALSKAKAHTR